MKSLKAIYRSDEEKSETQASSYLATHEAPHRYLAYKNLPNIFKRFVKGKTALDFGCGTGASTNFLQKQGFHVSGIDISDNMLEQARKNFPNTQFIHVDSLAKKSCFNLVFSSFVLFEISTIEGLVQYLQKAATFLSENGVFIGVTGSESLYSLFRTWLTFDASYPENSQLRSGDTAKLILKQPRIEFYDYFWTKEDYFQSFEQSGFELLEVSSPLGEANDPYKWEDELFISPFTTFIAKKISAKKSLKKVSLA